MMMKMITMEERSSRVEKTNSTPTIMADDSTEISIFDAQKYFNDLNLLNPPQKPTSTPAVAVAGAAVSGGGGGGNRVSPLAENIAEPSRFSSASSSIDSYNNINNKTHRNSQTMRRNRSFRSTATTPTASSEASWNSQTGLLSAPPGSLSVSFKHPLSSDKRTAAPAPAPPFSGGVRWLNLRRKCPCLCKKSVQVKENPVRTISESHIPIPQIALPPSPSPSPPPAAAERLVHCSIKSTMAEIRSGTIGNNTNFEQNWGNINSHHHHHHQMRRSLQSNNNGRSNIGFTFPILNNQASSSSSTTMAEFEDPARDSLEIFSPPSHSNRISLNNNTRNFTFLTSPTSRMRTLNAPFINNTTNGQISNITYVDVDDGASDASSDLFEIESFTTQQTTTTESTTTTAAHPSMFLFNRQRRDSLEEAAAMRRFPPISAALYHPISGLTAADYCYEPSEASIDWSVTTAEGFDRASVANASEADFGEYLVATSSGQPPHVAAVEKNRRRSSGNGLLMSCRCEKAVSVGPGPRPMSRVVTRPSSSGGGSERARAVGQGISLSSSSTLAMWAVGQKG
ncbi:hypothetical protein CsatB_027794 [Cannabis sativa]